MKNLKKATALILSIIMILMTMIIPVSAASKVDPSEGPLQKIEATFYQILDKLVTSILKVLNLLIPGLNLGDKWQNYDDYVSPDGFYPGESTFTNEVSSDSVWSAGYSYASLIEGLDVFNGKFYMAGTLEAMEGRVPTEIVDDQGVNVYAVSDGKSGTVVQAVIDGYGIARGDVLEIRDRLEEFAEENNIISINISVLHQHSGIDILGMGAPLIPALLKNPALSLIGKDTDEFVGGKSPEFMNNMYEVVSKAIKDAVNDMEEGTLYYGSIDASDFMYDKREPTVFDGNLHRFRFDPADENSNEIWICEAGIHCVNLGAGTSKISADFPYYFKEYVKNNTNADVVYVQGAELAITTEYKNVTVEGDEAYSRAKAFGYTLAQKAIQIDNETKLEPILNVKVNEVAIKPDNQILTLAVREGLINSVITKDCLGYMIISEIGYIELGNKVGIVLIPGEIAPELIWGGVIDADKSWTNESWEYKSMQETSKIDTLLCFGLCNDQIGYILADNDIRSMFTENEEINASSLVSGSTLTRAFEELIASVK